MERADETIEPLPEPGRAPKPEEVSPGFVVGDSYRLLERLGTGGMADVYEAEHLRLGNRVAVKFLRVGGRSDRKGVERFRHEARRVAALSSDHVVKVFDCGELPGGAPYLVMERLRGEDLRSLLVREGKLPVRRAVELAIGACRGLSVVHAASLVHRDLKPANLFMVRGTGEPEQCKILDFGVAKALVSDATANGTLLGTVRYMAPEQLEDAASARATADIYAIGAILYECLTGAPPHRGKTLQELMFNIVHRDVVPPRELCDLPVELERIVLKALARDKSKRFASADRMAHALAPFGAFGAGTASIEGTDEITLNEGVDYRSVNPGRQLSVASLVWLVVAVGLGVVTTAALRGKPSSKREVAARAAPVGQASGATPGPTSVVAQKPSETRAAAATAAARIAPVDSARRKSEQRAKPSAKRSLDAPAQDRFDSQNPYSD